MAWEQVDTKGMDIKKHKGEHFTGTLKGHHEIETKIGKQVVWDFEDEEGLGFGVYGFTMLNRSLEAISAGNLVRLTYLGTENCQTKYGMKDVHQVQVEIFREEKEPVAKNPIPEEGSSLPF
jgi:hypothetical protein